MSPAVQRAKRRRRVLVATGGIVGGLLVASLVVAASLLRPPLPVGVVAVGAHYASNLAVPHNADGWLSLEQQCQPASGGLLSAERSMLRVAGSPTKVDSHFGWRNVLRSFNHQTNLLIVSLHGGADEEGPYLISEDSTDPTAVNERLRIQSLLKELNKLPDEQQKILVLDATRIAGDWHGGCLVNDFAAGLRGLNDAIAAVPNLIVVSASDVEEQSWPEINGKGSVFLNRVASALQGHGRDQDDNGRLSMKELFVSVKQQVMASIRSGRDRSQTPVLLPLGDEGLKRAQQMEVALVASEELPHEHADPIDQETIVKRWEQAKQFEQMLDNPETTHTVAWRRYRRMLIRYEQLHLANAPELAKDVSDKLDDLEASVSREVSLHAGQLDPVQLAVVAEDAPAQQRVEKLLGQLWKAPTAQLITIWQRATSKLPECQTSAVQRLLYDRLLDRAAEKPLVNLPKAAGIARAIGQQDRPRPSEAHYLVMLAEGLPGKDLSLDLPEGGWNAALRLALETHRLSESMFEPDRPENQSLTPTLLPWLKQRCEKADALRREGEDLLFGGADYLPRATAALQQVRASYLELKREGKTIRRAVRVRNRAFDLLPFYTDCLAAQRMTTPKSEAELAPLLEACRDAWAAAHKLGDTLLNADASALSPNAMAQAVDSQTSSVEAAIAKAHDTLRAWRSDLLNRQGPAYANNRNAALRVPDLQIGERVRFLTKQLNDSDAKHTAQGPTKRNVETYAQREATLRGRLAVAAIGQRLYKKAHPTEPSYSKIAKAFSTEDAKAVSQQQARRALHQACDRLSTLVAPERSTSMDTSLSSAKRSEIALAAAIIRRHERGDVASSAMTLLDRLRDRRKFDYAVWRAERSFSDRWNSLVPGVEPYFRVAANAYLRQAERAVAGQQIVDDLAKHIVKPFVLELVVPESTDIVSGVAPPCPYQLAAEINAGAATVTATTSEGIELQTPSAELRRIFRFSDSHRSAESMIVRAKPDEGHHEADRADHGHETKDVEKLAITGWFRGHRALSETSVVIHRTPEIEIDQPPRPVGAGLAVVVPEEFASRFGQADGGVAFVLDASGSMGPTGSEISSKYVEALQALRSMLSETPSGVQVSVWVFGQAMGSQKTVEQAEATVRQVLPPVVWRANKESLIGRLMEKLAYPHVEPWNESPLSRAILAATKDLKNVRGFKTVVAITDGVDNRFANDRVANPRSKPLAEVLGQEVSAEGITLHVVGFRVAGAEKQQARQQFAFLDRTSPPGKWWEADQTSELEETLRDALNYRPRLPLTLLDSKGQAHQFHASTASKTGAPSAGQPLIEHQSLPAGEYSVQLPTAGLLDQKLTLVDGDLLLLSVQESIEGSKLSLMNYTANYLPEKPTHSVTGWRTTLLNNRALPNSGTSTLVAIESQANGRPGKTERLQQVRPQDLWFELQPAAGVSSASHARVAWQPVFGYAAPAWEITRQLSHDSASTPASLTAWWLPPGETTAACSLSSGHDFQSLADLVGRSWDVDGTPVTINRLAVETKALPDPTGKLVEQNCLVVELGGDSLCQVRLHGLPTGGQRHQFFKHAERYVGLFWPVDAAQLDQQLQRFDIVSISQLKEQARKQGTKIQFTEIAPAKVEDRRPLPAVDWLGSLRP